MPYELRRAACKPSLPRSVKRCFKVCRSDLKSKCFSKQGIPRARAKRQMAYLASFLDKAGKKAQL